MMKKGLIFLISVFCVLLLIVILSSFKGKKSFEGWFDDRRALDLMYDAEGKIYTDSNGKAYVQVPLTSIYSGEDESWHSIEPFTATVKILLLAPFRQEQADKYILLTEATYSEIPCHYCTAIIGGAIFSRVGNTWQMDIEQKYITGLGAWESAPPGELVRIGPDRYGALFREEFEMQGANGKWVVLITAVGEDLSVVLKADSDGDNLGACKMEGGKCWRYTSKTDFISGKNPSYYDFRIAINGIKATSSEIYSPESVPVSEIQVYTFTGSKYELSTPSK